MSKITNQMLTHKKTLGALACVLSIFVNGVASTACPTPVFALSNKTGVSGKSSWKSTKHSNEKIKRQLSEQPQSTVAK